MSCYHPLKGFPIGYHDSGKTKYKICSYEVDHLESMDFTTWYPVFEPKFNPLRKGTITEFVEIPCGNCIGCRLEYSRQWANRCMLELQYHKSAYFATLTYNNEHVPRSYYSDPETGEALTSLTLRKRDFQLFMKRLRRRLDYDKRAGFSDSVCGSHIRFFASGEYGSETFRPHYHTILFGLELNDLKVYRRDAKTGFVYYNSQFLQDVWSEDARGVQHQTTPLGHIVVAKVTWETCAYTARYVMKKLKGAEASFYSDHNIEPPFTLMSRKPGIARQWYDDHPDCFDYEFINIATDKGGRKFRPPKYYSKLYDIEYPEKSAELKEIKKRMAIEAKKYKLSNTSLSYLDLLAVEERAKEDKINTLRRSL